MPGAPAQFCLPRLSASVRHIGCIFRCEADIVKPLRDPQGNESRHAIRYGQIDGKVVLELGCGNGWLTWQLAGDAGSVFGLDPCLSDLVEGKTSQPAHQPHAWFSGGKAEHLPFASGTFDVALYANAL